MTKCKGENIDCVKLLAESLISKLVNVSISGKGWSNLKGRIKEEKPKVKCSLCDKVFSSKQYLKGHKTRVHKDKEFLCRVCNVKFNKGDNLKNHLSMVHPEPQERKRPTEPSQMECKTCNNVFSNQEELCAHNNLVHGNSIVRSCENCDMEFKAKYF